MCGIFGIVSSENVLKKILKGLTRLEYRGYDSSGIAINTDKMIITERSEGKLGNLKSIKKKKNKRKYRNRPYKMGNTWNSLKKKCPPSFDRFCINCSQWNY